MYGTVKFHILVTELHCQSGGDDDDLSPGGGVDDDASAYYLLRTQRMSML